MNDCVIINGEVLMNNSDKDVEKEKAIGNKDNIRNENGCSIDEYFREVFKC